MPSEYVTVYVRAASPSPSRSADVVRAAPRLGGGNPCSPRDQLQRLDAAQVRIQERFVGQVADVALERDRVGVAVAAQDGGAPRARAQQAHQQADGRGLAGAVRPRNPITSPASTRSVQIVDRHLVAESLSEPDGLDHDGGARRRRREPRTRRRSTLAPARRSVADHSASPRQRRRAGRARCLRRRTAPRIASTRARAPSSLTAEHESSSAPPLPVELAGRRRLPAPATAASGARRWCAPIAFSDLPHDGHRRRVRGARERGGQVGPVGQVRHVFGLGDHARRAACRLRSGEPRPGTRCLPA